MTTRDKPNLLTLPIEIRLMIYSYLPAPTMVLNMK